MRELILELVLNQERINEQFKPIISGVKEHEEILIKHTKIIKKLSEMTIENEEDIEALKENLELYNSESNLRYKEHTNVHLDIEEQIDDLKYRPIRQIFNHGQKNGKIEPEDYKKIEEFIEYYPDDSKVYSTIGHIFWLIDEDENKIRENFEKAIQLDADNSTAWCGLAIFSKDKEDFLKNFEKASKYEANMSCPTFILNIADNFIEYDEFEKALEYADKLLEIESEDSIGYFLKGTILVRYMNKPAQAISIFEKGLEYNSEDSYIYNNLGNCYGLLDKEDKSMECYKKSIEIDPNDLSALRNLGNVYYRNKKYDDALDTVNKLININPNSCDFCLRGRILVKKDKEEESIVDFKKSLEIFNDRATECESIFRFYLQVLFNTQNKEVIDKSISELDSIFNDNPNYLIALLGQHENINEYYDIEEIIEKIGKLTIEKPTKLNIVAYSLYELNKPENAIHYSNKLIKKIKNEAHFMDTYACILSKLEEDIKAKEFFIKAIEYATDKEQITWDEMEKLFIRLNQQEEYKTLREKLNK